MKQKDEERVDKERRLHRPFREEEALVDAYASLSVPVDSVPVAERNSDLDGMASAGRSQQNTRCQAAVGLTDCRFRQADSRRDG